MSTWTINGQAAAAIPAEKLSLRHLSQADGSFSFTASGREIDQPLLFDFAERVTLREGGAVRWSGPCLGRPVSGGDGAEDHRYTVASPWWWLEQQTLLQQWAVNGGAEMVWKSRCILGLAAPGVRRTLAQEITAIVNFAAACGWPVGVGSIVLGDLFPVVEVNGLKCAEAIRQLLRYAPSAVAWWTYSTGDCLLNIGRRAALPTVTLAVGVKPLDRVDISPREELSPGAVVIAYERVDTIDEVAVPAVVFDRAPGGATGLEPGAVHLTIDLAGGSVTYIKQQVEAQIIETNVSTGEAGNRARRFWGRKFGLIGRVTAVPAVSPETPAITFEKVDATHYFKRSMAAPSGADGSGEYELSDPNDPASDRVYLDESLPRELTQGQVMPWMVGVAAQRQIIRCKIGYTRLDGSKVKGEERAYHLVATDATTRLYFQAESITDPELPTEGLAATMLAELSTPHYQGSVRLEAEECTGAVAIGKVLNITGGQAGWSDMRALIQEVTENIDEGTTLVTVGPPEHLTVQNAVELQRCNRRPEGNTGNQGSNAALREQGTL